MTQQQYPPTIETESLLNPDLALPTDLTREYLIDKCEYFSAIGIWPRKVDLDPERWLDNFSKHEVEHALYLLNAFMYFDSNMVDQIFSASIRTIGRSMIKEQWKEFLNSAIVTLVTGETPSVTDSGHVFARRARNLGIPEGRIVGPEQASDQIQKGLIEAVVFVDDFVGSGNQFISTWHRTYRTSYDSYAVLAPNSSTKFYYCPAFCTQFGLNRIESECPEVTVSPGVFIPANYGALAPDSIVWPSHLRSTSEEFLRSTSARAGIPDTGGSLPNDWRGFGSLGLTIAFEDSVPDATLPIMYWDDNNWRPLVQRKT